MQRVFVLALEPSNVWLTLDPELFRVSPEDLEVVRKTRTGALISADIGKKYGWHIGDRIPLTSTTPQSNGSGTWAFDIVGMFTDHEVGEAGFIVTDYAYLDEARAKDKRTVRKLPTALSCVGASGSHQVTGQNLAFSAGAANEVVRLSPMERLRLSVG